MRGKKRVKKYVFAVIPAAASVLWFIMVIFLVFLAATVFTGGHPPFAVIPLALNIFGVIAIYPICLILLLIGIKVFGDEEIFVQSVSIKFFALLFFGLFMTEIKTNLTNEVGLFYWAGLSLLYPFFFFKNYQSASAKKQRVIWFAIITLVATISTIHWGGRPAGALLVVFAMLSNLVWLINPYVKSYSFEFIPKKWCIFIAKCILVILLFSVPLAVFLR